MPPAHQNINASYRLDQAKFLRSLASKDMGLMSQFLRRLVDDSQEFQAWQKARQMP